MVKPEKLDHLHLVYDFTVPLNLKNNPYLLLISYIFGGKFVKKLKQKELVISGLRKNFWLTLLKVDK